MSTDSPSNSPARNGFYVRGWVFAVVGVVILAAAAVVIGIAVGDGGDGDRREIGRAGGRFGDHHGGGGHVIGIIILLILIALAITAVVLLARGYKSPGSNVLSVVRFGSRFRPMVASVGRFRSWKWKIASCRSCSLKMARQFTMHFSIEGLYHENSLLR